MNAVEIEEAVSLLAEQPFEADAFPYAFLEAFGNKQTTIKRLQSGATNKSDVGGVLQRGNIHIKTCAEGEVSATLDALRSSLTEDGNSQSGTSLTSAFFNLATRLRLGTLRNQHTDAGLEMTITILEQMALFFQVQATHNKKHPSPFS